VEGDEMRHSKVWVVIGLLLISFLAEAQKEVKKDAKDSGKMKTLDFEGEVIEGEAMRPMLYLQIESPDLDLNNIMYQRKDFNDFHKIDKVRRNRFIPDSR
jgi:hypothetical protein